MEFDEFQQAVIFAFVSAKTRDMDSTALMRLVFAVDATMSIRARSRHDEGQRQATLFLKFMQKLEDQGLIKRTPDLQFANDNGGEIGSFRYTLTERVGFKGMKLAKS